MRVLSLSQLKFHPHNCERQSPQRRECVCVCVGHFCLYVFRFSFFSSSFPFGVRYPNLFLGSIDGHARKSLCARRVESLIIIKSSWDADVHISTIYLFRFHSMMLVVVVGRLVCDWKKNPVHVTAVPDKDLPVKVLDKKVLIDQPQCCNWVKIGFIHTEKFECAIWFVCSVFEMFHSRLYNTLFQSNKLNWGKKTSEKQQFKRKRELRISLHNRTVCFFLFHSSFYMYVLLFICKSIRTKLCDCFFVGQFFFCLVFWLC